MTKEKYKPTQNEMREAKRSKGKLDNEQAHKENGSEILLRYAENLNYDDETGRNGAVEVFRAELRELANQTKQLESRGFVVRVTCKPEKGGGAQVLIERNGVMMEIYSQFYGVFPQGFCRGQHPPDIIAYHIFKIREKISTIDTFFAMYRDEIFSDKK